MSLPALYVNFDELAIELVNKFKQKMEFASSIFQIKGDKELYSFSGENISIPGQYCIRRINIAPFIGLEEQVEVNLEDYEIASITINQPFDIYFESVFLINEFTNFNILVNNFNTIITLEVIRL